MSNRLVNPGQLDFYRDLVDLDLFDLRVFGQLRHYEAVTTWLEQFNKQIEIREGPFGTWLGDFVDDEGRCDGPVSIAFDLSDLFMALCCIALDENAPVFFDDFREAYRHMPRSVADSLCQERPSLLMKQAFDEGRGWLARLGSSKAPSRTKQAVEYVKSQIELTRDLSSFMVTEIPDPMENERAFEVCAPRGGSHFRCVVLIDSEFARMWVAERQMSSGQRCSYPDDMFEEVLLSKLAG